MIIQTAMGTILETFKDQTQGGYFWLKYPPLNV